MIIPRYYQKEAVDSLFQWNEEGREGNPLIGLPTGTGKSLVQSLFCNEVLQCSDERILCLTHVKELIQQNYNSLIYNWPSTPAGIYSEGVGRKDVGYPVTFAGIQSIHRNSRMFQRTSIVIIDEVQRFNKSEGTYSKFINELKSFNPNLFVVGLTATPFRTGQGHLISPDSLFTDFAYDKTDIDSFIEFIEQGFLCPLIPLATRTKLEVDGLKISQGEFSVKEMQERYNVDKITYNAIEEIIQNSNGRKHWLIFATGVEHCENIARFFNEVFGIPCKAVHSKLDNNTRDEYIEGFKRGDWHLVNNNLLTTGFDFNGVDLIAFLRATNSPGLWVQMLGRGTRPVFASGWDISTQEGRLAAIKASPKQNCLVLDFAANTERLGPINDPVIPKPPRPRKGDEPPREPPVKICDTCGAYMHMRIKVCAYCGCEFDTNSGKGYSKINPNASNKELIKTREPKIEIINVQSLEFKEHKAKSSGNVSFRITFVCGILDKYHKWLSFHMDGKTGKEARDFWRLMVNNKKLKRETLPKNSKEAMERTNELIVPKKIRVRTDTKYPEIKDIDLFGNKFRENKNENSMERT